MVMISKLYPEVIKMCRPLIIEDQVLRVLMKKFSSSISKSLNALDTPVKCNLAHVKDFPDGTETGSFIGLEFSGSIFRLVFVALRGDRTYVTVSRLYEFPFQKLNENVSKIMDYVARCIGNFIETYNISGGKIIVGVTSSFPMTQECLQEGKILQWGKDFQNPDLQDRDLFLQLKVSLKKYKTTKSLYLISLVNNSTACLMSGLYKHPGTRVGLYVGEHTNITYIEKFENIANHNDDGMRTRTAVGVEMRNFGDDGALDFIRTEFDYQIDDNSSNPGKFVMDKMVSGAYLGEIARLCLLKLASLKIILKGYVSPSLCRKDSLTTADLAMMEMDDENTQLRCKAVMLNLGYKNISDEDCVQIRFVCRCVAKRSSNLIAACLAALFHRLELRYVHVMADGILLKEFPNYEFYLNKKIQQLMKSELKCLLLKGDKEEAAVGAGIIALIYKDAIIKLEDKHRTLPPFNETKYNLNKVATSCTDCKEEATRPWSTVPSVRATPTVMSSEKSSEIFDFCKPIIPSSLTIK